MGEDIMKYILVTKRNDGRILYSSRHKRVGYGRACLQLANPSSLGVVLNLDYFFLVLLRQKPSPQVI